LFHTATPLAAAGTRRYLQTPGLQPHASFDWIALRENILVSRIVSRKSPIRNRSGSVKKSFVLVNRA
jgi:hypothetical protein